MEHFVNDGAVRMVDAYNSKKICIIRIKRVGKAVWQDRFAFKIGRPDMIIGEIEQTVLYQIKIESLSGAKNTPDGKVSATVAHNFIKKHTELKTSTPKIVDSNKLAVSCQHVLKSWVPDSSNRNVVHPANAKSGFAKSAARMANYTLIAAVVADGQSLPSVILWPSLKLSDDLKPLQKYALTILLTSIKERRQRMSLDEWHCLLLIDFHISRADPTIKREFKKENVDVVTFIPHSTHICQPLDRVEFSILKFEMSSQYEAPLSSSSIV
ncbi:uncharacterized protein MONOS_7159 [Monocercomonoides exilis]|uniref:uncharacterized protein n=1 Tax=Monocercomonoides exilis TaxID=2049356 RepID=UPI00355A8768|nr:hypothetical protein MONOS_7159 [Monocercomonoides exilis]|eukprot:MONOS_7159.1-p1 / transcript=MONOS_7159.1 / gene=MONOS_7159 / organism=Monocercomonoides_exilis_PA203 / gene_product=unspecified product / transcript_product=unspecified product / location=Mono_scaffold00238:63682-64731(+) / protein_length=267 / sequence_SO=supercontig / SO=protein_coding / is_pseudo=false